MVVRVKKRSVLLNGSKTSLTIEDQYWDELARIATERGTSRSKLVIHVSETRDGESLSSALRLYVLEQVRNRVPEKKNAA